MMELFIIFVAMVMVYGTTGSVSEQGVLMMRIPEKEFRDGADHLVKSYLLTYLDENYEFDDYEFDVANTGKVHFNNVKLTKAEGLDTRVDFRTGNYAEADFRYSEVTFRLNLNIVLGQDVIRYPSAVVSLRGVYFNVSLEIGTGDNQAGVTIDSCGMDFDTFDSSDEGLRSAVLGFIEIGAKDRLKGAFHMVCDYLENEMQAVLVDILNIEERLTIYDEENKLVSLNAKLEFVETGDNFISAVASASLDGGPTSAVDKNQIQHKFSKTSKDSVDVWLDDKALVILTDKVVTQSVFTDMQYNINEGGNTVYQVFVSLNSVSYRMDVTEAGLMVNANASLIIRHIGQTVNPCIDLLVDLNGRAPLIITYNDVKIVMRPDTDRLFIDYEIIGVAGKCSSKDVQTQLKLIKRYDQHFQAKLNDTLFYIDVPKTEILRFKNIAVKAYQDAVAIEGLLQLDMTSLPSVRNTTMTHRNAAGKKITLTTTDGQSTTLELKSSPTSLSCMKRGSIYVILMNILFAISVYI